MPITSEVQLYACCIEWSDYLARDADVFIALTEAEVYTEARSRIEHVHGLLSEDFFEGDHAEGHAFLKGEGTAITDNKQWYTAYHEITGMAWLVIEPVVLKIVH